MGFPNSKVMKASVVLPLLGKGQTKLRKREINIGCVQVCLKGAVYLPKVKSNGVEKTA